VNNPLLKVRKLSRHFVLKKNILSRKRIIHAVRDVDFDLYSGETLGLVGESGSGKTTIGNLVLRLLEPNKGEIIFDGKNISHLREKDLRSLRKDIQIIFQYSNAVLDPLMTIEELLCEALRIHSIVPEKEMDFEVDRLLSLVGLSISERSKFPSQMSGGQNQRIIIARAVAVRPKLIVCDEPVSALDVSVQGQILNLLSELKNELNLSYLFISHDLKVVRHISDRIAVMYKGNIVETGSRNQILNHPEHDYTKHLIQSKL
jgi:ABC-type oligopeptide transport system ATPase subunit